MFDVNRKIFLVFLISLWPEQLYYKKRNQTKATLSVSGRCFPFALTGSYNASQTVIFMSKFFKYGVWYN